jgi:polyribonucleotide nucleotidyltransferase
VESDGRVFIATADGTASQHAVEIIENLTREAKIGDVFLGKVVRIIPAGAFVNILPGKDGMVHISELAEGRVNTVEDEINIGDEINVMVIDIDQATGKISLSRRAILTGETAEERAAARSSSGGGSRGGHRSSGGGGGGGDRGGSRGGPRRSNDASSSSRKGRGDRDRSSDRDRDRDRMRPRRKSSSDS